MTILGKSTYVGTFDSEEDAVLARNEITSTANRLNAEKRKQQILNRLREIHGQPGSA